MAGRAMRLRPRSLKQQFLCYLLTALLCVWGITAYVTYQRTRDEIAELTNAELAQSARVAHYFVENMLQQRQRLDALWDGSDKPDLFFMPILGHKYERKIAFQLRSVAKGVILRSESAPDFALSLTRNGFSDTVINDQLWHVFSISTDNGHYVIHVGQRDDIRQQLISAVAGHQVISLMIVLPVLGGVIWLIVSRTLRPLDRVVKQLATRQAGNLQPLSLLDMPDEALPMLKQINALFALLEQAFTHERHFTSDASHELRTPLAGLRTQLQVAQKATDPAMRTQALQQCQQAVLRMTHLVQQLLTLARVQHQNVGLERAPLDVHAMLVSVIADLEHHAHDKQIDIELLGPDTLALDANAHLLAILLRNLIDNAIKYTPPGGKVLVSTHADNGDIRVSVEDSGPGVAATDYGRITQRFYRGVETAQTAEGSGLGLSIVQRIVDLHDADSGFGPSALGGLQAWVRFPRRAQAVESPIA
ncbi:MAG: sensor histidine kinase N-terminal domain-containing protein [Methylomonas sp.]|nr:sensor histidine kinase N-terminal domain-containing protein [Methylomonas sp.]PPD22212.1 MAG: two-component sensor histidine kinase [Methylomonas sp.]PPD27749.1 MAG: two-component sensor histidine kinase [Methylomonas sp.]PPD39760.1 MAG: two-component sensor histidine kinase [Methylomonas sp.]PPD42533.1 MAG: two-component sensor histidine kinase [Methylomonas sp.]